MQMTISFSLCLCLLNIVKASSTYSYMNNNEHSDKECDKSSLENGSCTSGPEDMMKDCVIPTVFKALYVERDNFDEIDGYTDQDCCCPTLRKNLYDVKFLTNLNNEEKTLAYGNCTKYIIKIPVGICVDHSPSNAVCLGCRQVKREHTLLVEEDGQHKLDRFNLDSHCACTGKKETHT